jgi:hypothetical protein
MKNRNDPVGNRTRDLPACSVVPKSKCVTVPPPPPMSNNLGVKESLIEVTLSEHRRHQVYLTVLLMAIYKSKRLLVRVFLTMCCLGAVSSKQSEKLLIPSKSFASYHSHFKHTKFKE